MVGNWSACVMPSTAAACSTRVAAMRTPMLPASASLISCRSASSWKTAAHGSSPNDVAVLVVVSPRNVSGVVTGGRA